MNRLLDKLHEWLLSYMGAMGMILYGGGKGGGGGSPPPDYGPMAEASKYATDMGEKLGTMTIDEAKRQYNETQAANAPILETQKKIMDQTYDQAGDYYKYGLQGREVEGQLKDEAMMDNSARDAAERGLITGGDADIYNARRDDIEQGVGRATADARQGTTAQYNQLLRQGMRYGYSPQAMAQRFGSQATAQGLGIASAANQARQQGIDSSRALLGQNRNLRIQDDALATGRKMDVAGLYRGMPGASQGAYGVALGAGNSATSNQMAPGAQYMAGLGQGTQAMQTGYGQNITGQGAILNAQTSAYNTGQQAASAAAGQSGQMFGAVLGTGVALY